MNHVPEKPCKKFFACLLVLCLCLAALAYPASAAQNVPNTPKKNCSPIVFVHGLGGWGEDTPINGVSPHWGMGAGSIKEHLGQQGYEAYAVSVGPSSSAWDRACEMYAHITGTRVDYGEAHAKAHGHNRFGATYEQLVPNWSKTRKLHLIGHSFGGATVRLFAQLCENGSAAECKATPAAELSPLFSGAMKGRIASVTTLAAPHNGVSSMAQPADATMVENSGGMAMMALFGAFVPVMEYAYPARLSHFWVDARTLYQKGPKTLLANYESFSQGTDTANYDLSVDGAAQLNKGVSCLPGIYYFSYAAQTSQPDKNGNHVPTGVVTLMFRSGAKSLGQKREPFTTAGGIRIDDAWLPNDGMVNVVSALYPFNGPHQNYSAKQLKPGIWNVMPIVTKYEHADFCGGPMRVGGAPGLNEFYLELAQMLEGLPQ